MAITIFGGDLKTGLIRVRNIPAANGACSVVLSAAGTISAGVPLPMKSPLTDVAVDIRNILLPGKSFLGWEENGYILNAGPIWNDSYDFGSKKFTMNAAGLRSYWQYRYVLPTFDLATENPNGRDSSWSGMSLRTIAKRLVQQAQAWTNGSVPVVFEADFAGSAIRNYEGHELHVVDEKLRQISEVENGPDIMFSPRFTTSARTHIEWVMRTGDPFLASPVPHKWDMSGIPTPSIKGASISRDASVLASINYQVGSTDEADPEGYPLMGVATSPTLTDLGYPIFESSKDRTSVKIQGTLDEYADEAVDLGAKYAETWKFQTRKNLAPQIGTFEVGDYGRIATLDDAAVGTDDHQVRILEISTTKGSGFATVTCATSREPV